MNTTTVNALADVVSMAVREPDTLDDAIRQLHAIEDLAFVALVGKQPADPCLC